MTFWKVAGLHLVTFGNLNPPEEHVSMTDLERDLTRVLDEHQHESGLHVIGGQKRLIERLVEFLETGIFGKGAQASEKFEN
jgi:hypothetical protein